MDAAPRSAAGGTGRDGHRHHRARRHRAGRPAVVVLACTWRLLSLVEHDRIFSEGAFVWVDLIVGALAVAWVLFAGFAAVVGLRADDPGGPLVLFALLLVGGVVGLLVVVMRALLRQATVLRDDLEGVI